MNTMKSILVLTEDYPNPAGGVSMYFVHTRNLLYREAGLQLSVLNFSAASGYDKDGIRVITYQDYLREKENYSFLISHAPNLRHHYVFLKKHLHDFSRFCFFFHGHEVLRISKVYSKPYPYNKENALAVCARDLYDGVKLAVWRSFFPKIREKASFIFVSQWMQDEFFRWTKIDPSVLLDHCHITYNGIGRQFENTQFDGDCEKKYDFLTIRSNLDGSKYCVDLVNQIAKQNPQYRFLLIGKGRFFDYYEKAENLEWRDTTLSHAQIMDVIQQSRYALMPTRTDAQGLMMCEMASTGMPLITSDIPVCREVFADFENIAFIPNELERYEMPKILASFGARRAFPHNQTYYAENTGRKEIALIKAAFAEASE